MKYINELKLTDEIIDKLYTIFGIHDLRSGDYDYAYSLAINEFPNISKSDCDYVLDEFNHDNPY